MLYNAIKSYPSIYDSAEDGMRVHFEVTFEPIFTAVNTAEVTSVLAQEFEAPIYLTHLKTLPGSLHIEVRILSNFI